VIATGVTFFFPDPAALAGLTSIDPDRDWREFLDGPRIWILQTWLRLTRAGRPVEISATPPPAGLVVFHSAHRRALARRHRRVRDAILVGVRGDHREPLIADYQVLQNGFFADGRRRFFIPTWIQPALVPRDPARGSRIERAAFKGFDQSQHPGLRSAAWSADLAARGITWVHDSLSFESRTSAAHGLAWPDYREIDLVVALRPPDRRLHVEKPASKLINAWSAGVPAVLGPEYAYRELRRSDHDYIEVSTVDEARAAIDRLRGAPELYLAMVENGKRRALEFDVAAITASWAELLFETLPGMSAPRSTRLPLPVRSAGRRLVRLLTRRPAK